MEQKFFRSQGGFSLVEVIVAMVLITTIGAAMTSLYLAGIKASVQSKERLDGLVIAQDLLEEIRAERDASTFIDVVELKSWLIVNVNQGFIDNGNGELTKVETLNNGNSYEVTVILEDSGIDASLVQIIIEVKPIGKEISPVRLGTRLFIE